jgi:hypothetical protein
MRWTVSRVFPLVNAFLQMAAIGSLWAYMELLGKAVGLDARDAQFVTSEVLIMQVLGGIAATWSVRRFAVVPTLGAGSVALAAVAGGIYLVPVGAESPFKLLCAILGFTWLFLMPFQISLAFRADARGQVALLIPAAQLVGSAGGPFAASLTVSGNDVHNVPLVSLVFAFSAAAIVAAGRRLWVKTDAPEVEVLSELKALDDAKAAR